jgi:pimeloyl-ACP methyl ester carboxylesterase
VKGCAFIDPEATATDLEDGDLTDSIKVTGSVNTNAFGQYFLTYSVTDSQGLSDTKTRQVIVFGAIGTPTCFVGRPEGKARNLVVLVHGCCTSADDVRNGWESRARLIAETIVRNQIPGGWEIVVWDWRKNEETGVDQTPRPPIWNKEFLNQANIAYKAAKGEGDKLANVIDQFSIYEHIHLIGHSAGGKLINEAAQTLSELKNQKNAEKPFIHLTFLDSYTPNNEDRIGDDSYGYLPDYPNHFAEHYVDRSLPFTDAILRNAFNFDSIVKTPGRCGPSRA